VEKYALGGGSVFPALAEIVPLLLGVAWLVNVVRSPPNVVHNVHQDPHWNPKR
jgi:hypothetical protein